MCSKYSSFPAREDSTAFIKEFAQVVPELDFCPHYQIRICFAANETLFFLSYKTTVPLLLCDKLMNWQLAVVALVIPL